MSYVGDRLKIGGMMEAQDNYHGREHSRIKHDLLKAYLERLFMIIGQFENKICYVDCFAGPWQDSSDNFQGTSFAISLGIMQSCKEALKKRERDVAFRALFIEKNKKAFKKLKEFLNNLDKSQYDIEVTASQGDFFDKRNDIIDWCKDDFAFLFVDPKGWKRAVELTTLHPLLERKKSEFLITFMYDFINRTLPQPAFQEDMRALLGEKVNVEGMHPKSRETYILKKYRDNLKSVPPSTNQKPRTAYMSIVDFDKNKTKYHLVYLTRHPKGIVVFKEASEGLYATQIESMEKVKQQKRIEKTRQNELFDASLYIDTKDHRVNIAQVKAYWLQKLSDRPKRFGVSELADMLEETDWFIGDLQKAFAELQDEGKVKNIDAKQKRPKHAVNFGNGERLQRINP